MYRRRIGSILQGMTTNKLPNIADELAGLDHVPVASIEPFQGDLKELSEREYNKLKKSILENNLIVPFFVWLETNKLLDGHQRQRVFMREGWLIDVPVVYISAKSEQDAKRKLLVISSQYGKVTQEGWDTFTWDLEDDWLQSTVQFDAIKWVFDDIELPQAPNDWKEYDESAADSVEYHECPECGHKWPK